MNDFEKYLKLKEEYRGYVDDDILVQYLTIVQMLSREQEKHEAFRKDTHEWLNNIEKTMKWQKERYMEDKNET